MTPASVYDQDVAFELLENSPMSLIYGDKGYVDTKVKAELTHYGGRSISKLSKNMVVF
ncbi:hypothetical protein [Streptococcus sp. 'caviae']|uniref:hypothetical protein n=1 Tax=Streptococcus sp. 'caviae' TaxID=1915004 RepID=UPI0015D664AF|nr:hypothetical protein [Streptococcus sp. 'caviae']